ncbi:uncharacterized protein BDW43DRAFT_315727 [Aspergillus alliaceus]|uniref:uncharacterized protein n=1 Tax=Petromyces alliaceus TaxID=209559 RepID=UPI0012A4EBE6|nr:uncharacterized protein BDW43DRAFT_315727 [Aspergillus alliaceus]KAB8228656.1 hypothetical protein BDW43DRAFT_315727 [Aspergillus alliaceus]
MSRLKTFHSFQRPSQSLQTNITQTSDKPWEQIGPGKDYLLQELEDLYWAAVKVELENIIRTLKVWQQPEYVDICISDENDNNIHGFDTFLDQVCQESRAFAIRYGETKVEEMVNERSAERFLPRNLSYKEALRRVLLDTRAEYFSKRIREEVRGNLHTTPRLSGVELRAWMLLQNAGFLDIDKLIEHRPPLDKLGFWKRPAIPQLTISDFDEQWVPQFAPMQCAECRGIIRGSMFMSRKQPPDNIAQKGAHTICEDCYRTYHYGDESLSKRYKHCVLSESIQPATSRKMCACKDVPHFDTDGRPRSLFPLNEEDNHIAYKAGYRCTVLKLSELVPYAKYQGLLSTAKFKRKRKRRLSDIQWISNMVDRSRGRTNVQRAATQRGQTHNQSPQNVTRLSKQPALRSVTEQSRQGDQRDPVSSKTSGVTEAQANEDIPLFFRQFTEKYPFGNVHMALRVGPLVIENGVSHTKAGALITMRETPVLNDRFTRGAHRRSLAVGGDPERLLWQQERQVGQPKRYKAVMKQIVGAPFTGILSQGHESKQEREIVELMVAASKQPFDNPGLPIMEKQRILDGAMSYILEKLRNLLNSRVKIYLNSIAQHLLDPGNTLTWSATSNNCQNFCNSLIDSELFEPLVNGLHMQSSEAPSPLYLMSFVCPPEGYLNNKVISKFDVPSGLTEEYLLRFHYGRHDEADIIDTLQEYWYDWGAFESPLYKYQDLFPWDCTEAYMRYPTKCGDCNLSKHVWAFPFDSWSIIALHHYRDKHMYQPKLDLDSKGTDSWIKDRLTILTASSILARAATAMAKSATFCKATAWLHSKEKGLRRIDPSLARVKLGGIHRAQPFSHYFEAGTYSHYFLAEWALKKKMDKIRDYETLRDGRARRPDISSRSGGRFLGTSREPSNFDRLFDGFRGMDGTDPDYTGCDDRGQIETDAQFDQQTAAAIAAALIADSQLDCVQNAEHMVAEAAAAAANCGSGCGSVTEPSHVCGSSSSGGGYSSGGGGSSSCGGGSSSCGGGGSSCGGGGSGGGCD